MKATTQAGRLLPTACLALVVGCADAPAEGRDGPRLLSVDFTEEFRVGDDPDEHQFSMISAMAFAPGGELVVVDGHDFAVIVFDEAGNLTANWGREGDGPGEFPHAPDELAISDAGTVAVETFTRIDLFTLDGSYVTSRVVRPLRVHSFAFYSDEAMVAIGERGAVGNTRTPELVRLDDGEVLWTSSPVPSITGDGPISMWQGLPTFLALWDGRAAIGMSDAYDLRVLDVASGRTVGRIERDVPLKGPTDEFMDATRAEMAGTPVAGRLEASHPFPVVMNPQVGPPGRTVWIGRGAGIGDSLSPPVGRSMSDWTHRQYDLFDGDTYEYLGTVEIPEGFILMTGDETRIAGFERAAFDVQTVRVLRVEVRLPASRRH